MKNQELYNEIINDKKQEFVDDVTDFGAESECCGAPIFMEAFCGDCKDHCK